jgi:FAD/FMN-containing dehydrogenase
MIEQKHKEQQISSPTFAVPEASTLEALHASLRGELLRPGDAGYDDARKIHNGMIDRHPALIVRCAGAADVINAVNFARENHLLVAVRGGGHNVAGFAVCEGGLMIDLSRMRSVWVDPVRQTARAEGGATWGDFDHETEAFGLATTSGSARPTGIGGLTLGGGHGHLMRRFGLASDNLLSVDLVTADGQLRRVSSTEHADLFWGVRGGGGNFGVVTSFEYQLHPVGTVLGGMIIYPIQKAKEFLRLYRDFTSTAPDEFGSTAMLAALPDGTPMVCTVIGFSGSLEEGERLLQPLRTFGPPLQDLVRPMPYTGLQSIIETVNPIRLRNYWKSSYLQSLSDEAIDTMVDFFASVPAPHTHVVIEHLGGEVSRRPRDETAFSHRDAQYNLLIVGMWSNPGEDDKNIRWVRGLREAMQPFVSGEVYVNYETDQGADINYETNQGVDRVKAAYSPSTYARLVALKNKYDPTNLFRLNQNIKPTV